jgi:cellulose synthase/poly-beta-1,6-N-acetylglucosamine synthase-like glycosyltransferase
MNGSKKPKLPAYNIHKFSMLAGPLKRRPNKPDYSVEFKNVNEGDINFYKYWSQLLAYGAMMIALALAVILFQPSNWVVVKYPVSPNYVENWAMLICLMILQVCVIVRTFSATRSTLKAKNPVPVGAPKGLKVAFCTTRSPGEPVEMAMKTLLAAQKIKYSAGSVDVWLLDETGDNELQMFCIDNKIHYFSRSGIKHWNVEPIKNSLIRRMLFSFNNENWTDGSTKKVLAKENDLHFGARTKHGNYNSWLDYLELSNIDYDILAGVDTDQVPFKNYLQRILGYFNDPDVAYAVGPQVYGNSRGNLSGLVSRWAESQASFFQSTIQRAANTSSSAMFVGTNYAIRLKTLRQIGGFKPCITEDMATGLAIHAEKNPETNLNWKSVYTPDVLAVGEGPDFWAPYFTQQWRWAAGTFDTWRTQVWKCFFKLSPRVMLHYLLILSFYPMAALTWAIAIISGSIYLLTGGSAINAPWGQFLSLYLMAAVMQLSLYFWNRRYNVSPHEAAGSYGVSGMLMTTLAAPIYLSALIGVLIGKKSKFVVTQKGADLDNTDSLSTFRIHLMWAVLEIGLLIYGISKRRYNFGLVIWSAGILLTCMLPFILSMMRLVKDRPIRLNKLTVPMKGALRHAQ